MHAARSRSEAQSEIRGIAVTHAVTSGANAAGQSTRLCSQEQAMEVLVNAKCFAARHSHHFDGLHRMRDAVSERSTLDDGVVLRQAGNPTVTSPPTP